MSDSRRFKTLDDIDLLEKTVFVRVDYNVTIGKDGRVDSGEDYRIEASLPTLRELREKKCKIILATHLGRPKTDKIYWDLEPVRLRLQELLGEETRKSDYLYGPEVERSIKDLPAGGFLILPNVRMDVREESNDLEFARELLGGADVYVNEAFSVCHRQHASVAQAPLLLPSAAGRRTVLEVEALEVLCDNPEMPYVAIVSGAKIATKVGLLKRLLEKVDEIYVGGQIANLFLYVAGKYAGDDFEDKDIELGRELWEAYSSRIRLPVDVVVGPEQADGTEATVLVDEIPVGAGGVWDVGPATVGEIVSACETAKTVLWNGPIGRVEMPGYERSSVQLARALADIPAYVVVGGGDTVNLLEREALLDKFEHVSIGGGALVAFLEGQNLPGLEPLYA